MVDLLDEDLMPENFLETGETAPAYDDEADDAVYWALKSGKAVIDKVKETRKTNEKQFENSSIFNKVYRSLVYYYGSFDDDEDWSDTAINVTGEYGQVLDFTSNYYRYFIRQLLTMITAETPHYRVTAANVDVKSRVQARLGKRIIDFYQEKKGVNKALRKALEDALIYGVGFLAVTWDESAGEALDGDPMTGELFYEGDVEVRNVDFIDVVWNYDGYQDLDQLPWIAYRCRVNKYDLIEKFPEHKDAILAEGLDQSDEHDPSSIESTVESDDVFVWKFYHDKTVSVANGRYVLALGDDTVLFDSDLPYRRKPVYIIRAAQIRKSLLGWSPAFDIQKQQELINEILGKMATVVDNLGYPLLWGKSGAKLPAPSQFVGNICFIEADEPPKLVDLVSIPEVLFTLLEMTVRDMEKQMGLNAPVQGEPQGSVRANRMQLFAAEQTRRFNSPLEQAYYETFEAVGTAIIEILQDFPRSRRTITLVGQRNEDSLVSFTAGDIYSVTGVSVERGSPILKSTEGKLEVIDILTRNQVAPLSKEEIVSVLQGAPLEAITEGIEGQLDRVNAENEALMRLEPHFALATDNHILDIKKHSSILNSPRARSDPRLVQHVLGAILEHMQLYNDPGTFEPQMFLGYATIPPAAAAVGGVEEEEKPENEPQKKVDSPQ